MAFCCLSVVLSLSLSLVRCLCAATAASVYYYKHKHSNGRRASRMQQIPYQTCGIEIRLHTSNIVFQFIMSRSRLEDLLQQFIFSHSKSNKRRTATGKRAAAATKQTIAVLCYTIARIPHTQSGARTHSPSQTMIVFTAIKAGTLNFLCAFCGMAKKGICNIIANRSRVPLFMAYASRVGAKDRAAAQRAHAKSTLSTNTFSRSLIASFFSLFIPFSSAFSLCIYCVHSVYLWLLLLLPYPLLCLHFTITFDFFRALFLRQFMAISFHQPPARFPIPPV